MNRRLIVTALAIGLGGSVLPLRASAQSEVASATPSSPVVPPIWQLHAHSIGEPVEVALVPRDFHGPASDPVHYDCITPCTVRVPPLNGIRYVLHIRTDNGSHDVFAMTIAEPESSLSITPPRSRVPGVALFVAGFITGLASNMLALAPAFDCNLAGSCRVPSEDWFVAAGIGAAMTVGLETAGIVLYVRARGHVARSAERTTAHVERVDPWFATGMNAFVMGASARF